MAPRFQRARDRGGTPQPRRKAPRGSRPARPRPSYRSPRAPACSRCRSPGPEPRSRPIATAAEGSTDTRCRARLPRHPSAHRRSPALRTPHESAGHHRRFGGPNVSAYSRRQMETPEAPSDEHDGVWTCTPIRGYWLAPRRRTSPSRSDDLGTRREDHTLAGPGTGRTACDPSLSYPASSRAGAPAGLDPPAGARARHPPSTTPRPTAPPGRGSGRHRWRSD